MLKYNMLGNTGLKVSELCFGALPMGPLQKNLSVDVMTALVIKAIKEGINFIDTAQMYKTYEPIRRAIKETGIRPIIASKSTAITYEEMQKAIEEALDALDIKYIDIFHLHAARAGVNVFEERQGALRCLEDNKRKGIIKAIGISTHSVKVVDIASTNQLVDVVFPIINIDGIGILDGDRIQMEQAINKCYEDKKGIYLMKVLGGGNIINKYFEAMNYAFGIEGVSSFALGMVSIDEVDYNLEFFALKDKKDNELSEMKIKQENLISNNKKAFSVTKFLCKNCGLCVSTCPNHAISVINNIAEINANHCLQCGYCVGACPQFAIRMI